MKVLLDENLPHQLRHELTGVECFSVAYMQWRGLENGALLRAAKGDGFDVLLTLDANFQYQQNLKELPLAVVVVRSASNDLDVLRPLVPFILEALLMVKAGEIRVVG